RPSAATASQSRPRGHLVRSASAIGSNSRNQTPNRKTPRVTGSLAPIANRVVPPAAPPNALDATAASTPTYSFRKGRMGGQERRRRATVHEVAVQIAFRAEDYRASLWASPPACPAASPAP